jgi:hypothetical protein
MSGGGGSYGYTTSRSSSVQTDLLYRGFIPHKIYSSICAYCIVTPSFSGDLFYYDFVVTTAHASRCMSDVYINDGSTLLISKDDPVYFGGYFTLDVNLNKTGQSMLFTSLDPQASGCYPRSGTGNHPQVSIIASTALTTAIGLLTRGNPYVAIAMSVASILGSLIDHTTQKNDTSTYVHRVWSTADDCTEAFQYLRVLVAAPIDEGFNISFSHKQGVSSTVASSCSASFNFV